MNKLRVKLNQTHRSFKKNFEYIFEGDLIILSGVNGAGKSQLLNIIYGQENQDVNKNILSEIILNEENCTRSDVIFKSFRESISIPELTAASSQSILNSKNQAWNYYNNFLLDPDHKGCLIFSRSCKEVREVLIKKFGKDSFQNKHINLEDFKKGLPNNFIWRQDDVFSNIIGEVFYNFAARVHNGHAQARGGSVFDEGGLGVAPWKELNDLFAELKLEYRFKQNYYIVDEAYEINEQPRLYPIGDSGVVDEDSPRQLADLSDGEKAILSLAFASLSGVKKEQKKILLLDEYDATFNASLTAIFFKILDKYFISKGILVIFSTHSIATLALAPEEARYYEIYKESLDKPRILEVNRDNYTDLRVVNKRFFDQIADQQQRIEELQNSKMVAFDKTKLELCIYTEGKTDWRYFLKALEYFHSKNEYSEIKTEYFIKYGSKNDVILKKCGTEIENEMGDGNLESFLNGLKNTRLVEKQKSYHRVIGIFDSDNKNIKIIDEELLRIHSFKIDPDGISSEILFDESELKAFVDGKRLYLGNEFDKKTKQLIANRAISLGGDSPNSNKAGKRIVVDMDVFNEKAENIALSKDAFSVAVFNGKLNISDSSWEKFRHIFENIRTFIARDPVAASAEAASTSVDMLV